MAMTVKVIELNEITKIGTFMYLINLRLHVWNSGVWLRGRGTYIYPYIPQDKT